MKKRLCVFLLMLLAATIVFSAGQQEGENGKTKTEFLTMGTGSPGGVYYPLGGGMAVVIEKTIEGIRCAAESTGASVENCRLVGVGDTDMGMVMGSVAYKATKGIEPFENTYPIMSLFQMYPAPEHIVTTAQSGIKTFADLKGKKVSIDVPGSGCSAVAKAMLSEYGFDLEKDLKLADLTQSESVQALKDGIVDACFFNFAFPASAVMDLAATRDLVMVPIEKDFCDKLVAEYPYYVSVMIPAGTYPNVDYDVLCLGDSNVMICNKDMSEDNAYNISKAIFENASEGKYALTNIHPIAAQLSVENAVNSPIGLHPGALKYFENN